VTLGEGKRMTLSVAIELGPVVPLALWSVLGLGQHQITVERVRERAEGGERFTLLTAPPLSRMKLPEASKMVKDSSADTARGKGREMEVAT
jgi:hypothetical protein